MNQKEQTIVNQSINVLKLLLSLAPSAHIRDISFNVGLETSRDAGETPGWQGVLLMAE